MKPLPARIWLLTAFIPMVASKSCACVTSTRADGFFGITRTFRRTLRFWLPWLGLSHSAVRHCECRGCKSPCGSSASSSSITPWRLDQVTGNHLFPSTVLGHYPLSIGWLHWFDILFGLSIDTYTEEVVFRRCARQVFEPYLSDGLLLVLVTSLLFGAYHWWSGVGNILAAMLMGVLFMLFFQRSGSLWPVVLSHYLTDVANFA